jgi:predicted RNA-binding Zn-ribbon protein involved in translation (DUF1610 family)
MFDPNAYKKPIGKCRKCGIDLYLKKEEKKITKCPNCGPITSKDINHYIYPSNLEEIY